MKKNIKYLLILLLASSSGSFGLLGQNETWANYTEYNPNTSTNSTSYAEQEWTTMQMLQCAKCSLLLRYDYVQEVKALKKKYGPRKKDALTIIDVGERKAIRGNCPGGSSREARYRCALQKDDPGYLSRVQDHTEKS